jgi:O-antigen/teichoic acid export membrane protein
MKQDTFSTRYIVKLVSSIIVALINALLQIYLPRALDVDMYGFYSYNLNVFTSVVVMANLSASNALVAKYSKRNDERGLIIFYLSFFFIVSLVLNIITALIILSGISTHIFGNQTAFLIMLGLNAAVLSKLLTDVTSMYDSMALSRFPAIMQVILKIVICLFITIGYFIGTLNLYLFYIVQGSMTAVIVFLLLFIFIKNHKKQFTFYKKKNIKGYIQEFYYFCKPLVILAFVSQGMVIIKNWTLLNYSGETEQAMFGVALQLNILFTYIFSPYAELSKREFAVIADDLESLGQRLVQAYRIMFWLISYFAIFTLIYANWIIPVLFTSKYEAAIPVTRLMMLYTIYQAWGQISGSYLLGTEKTGIQASLGLAGEILSLGMMFLFQMPNRIFPSGFGAMGIALNYSIVNIVSTSLIVVICMKSVKQSLFALVRLQFIALSLCLFASMIIKIFVDMIFPNSFLLFKIICAGLLYTLVILGVLKMRPNFFGLSQESLYNIFKR